MSEMIEAQKQYSSSDYIPMSVWGKDHWSTFAYMETVMVETGRGFQVGHDPRMRANRRNYRVMLQQCSHPVRFTPRSDFGYTALPPDKYGTRLNTGQEIFGHCDWCCVQDFANAGLLSLKPGEVACDAEAIEPGVFLFLSEKGQRVAAALRKHKAEGGVFHYFVWME